LKNDCSNTHYSNTPVFHYSIVLGQIISFLSIVKFYVNSVQIIRMITMPSIHLLHLTDIHGAGFMIDSIGQEIAGADLVIISGDITHFGREKEAKNLLEKIRSYNRHVLAVPGNCDYPEVEQYLISENSCLHKKAVRHSGFILAGLGGSLPCPGTTPFEFTETEADLWLKQIECLREPHTPFLFIAHQPPFDTMNDDLGNGDHVGSRAVRQFILNTKPVLCATGHIHEGIGIDTIGNCKIVNPGPFRHGNYAIIHITGGEYPTVEIQLKRISEQGSTLIPEDK
jgi:uncharacterized protein